MNTTNQPHNLQDEFLDNLKLNKHLVDIYLINGIRLQGTLTGFDKYAVHLNRAPDAVNGVVKQIVYKHAISTISYTIRERAKEHKSSLEALQC